MRYEPKCLICSPRTDFGPSCARGSHSNRDASSGTYCLTVEQPPWHALLLAYLHRNPKLSLLTANRRAFCSVDSTGTRHSSSGPRFETCTYIPAAASWSVIGAAVLGQRAGTRSSREGEYATNEYRADDGAAFRQATKLLHTKGR